MPCKSPIIIYKRSCGLLQPNHIESSWLANLGAVIAIAAQAVDPFSQQIIQSEPC